MDETLNNPQPQEEANQPDAFLSAWDDEPGAEPADQQEDVTETVTEEPQPEPTPAEPTEDPTPTQEEAPASATLRWTVNHLGEQKVFNPEDITPELIQKGLDYDRLREKQDTLRPIETLLNDAANKAGKSTAEYITFLRQEIKKSAGYTEADARRAVELDDREAAVKAAEEAANQQKAERDAQAAKVQQDLTAFREAFPDIYTKAQRDPSVIPKSVWEAVNTGKPLVAAYAEHIAKTAATEVAAAKAREDAARIARNNADRSTGSMKSAGNDSRNVDPFLEAWDNA